VAYATLRASFKYVVSIHLDCICNKRRASFGDMASFLYPAVGVGTHYRFATGLRKIVCIYCQVNLNIALLFADPGVSPGTIIKLPFTGCVSANTAAV
jgi:hypothetical protein